MRSARYVVWLAWKRLRRRESGAAATVLGLAVGAAALACLLVGVGVATDRSTGNAVERIPADQRALRAAWFGVPASDDVPLETLDGDVREAVAGAPVGDPARIVLVRESTVAGRFVGLAAVDGLAPHVVLRSGRLPRACTPVRCEVLRLRGEGRLPSAPGLRLVEVGTATLRSRQLFGDFLEPTDNATADAEVAPALSASARYHRPAPAPLVVAEGVEALAGSPTLDRTYRTYAWVWPLGDGEPRRWEIDALISSATRARAALALRSSGFAVDLPEQELRAAERTATVAGRRLLLVGGEAAALLLAFAVLASRGMRRDLDAARRRLTWHGARRSQLALLTVAESAAVSVAGVALGWVVGTIAGAALTRSAGAPVGAVLAETVASPLGIAAALGALLVTTALVVACMSLRGRRGAFGLLDAVAVVAVIVVAAALLGGAADEDRLASSESSGLVLLLLPGLLALAAAVASARLLPVLTRLGAARGGLSTRLAAAGLGRGPGTMVATLAFLTLAFSLALLAEGYRATLTRGEREQAAFQVPLDVSVREDLTQLVRVFDAASPAQFERLAGDGGHAYPVLRLRGGAGRAEGVSGVTVLGVERGAIEGLRLWRDGWTGTSRTGAAALVAPDRDMALRSEAVPTDGLELRAGQSLVGFAVVVRLPDGSVRRVALGEADARSPVTLRASAPRGARIAAVQVIPPARLIEGGATAGSAYRGSVELRGPLARAMRSWTGVGDVELRPSENGVELRYALSPQRSAVLRPRQPTDDAPPAVLATRRLAELAGGVGGLLPLRLAGETVPVRVAGVVERFPGVTSDAVVGDRQALQTAVESAAPGAGRDNEVWLDVPTARRVAVDAALAEPPFRALASESRERLEADARRDPLARGTLVALTATALVALVLAAIGLALAVRADLRDDSGELYELEAQGATPSLLRRVVRARALAVSVAGIAAGALAGAVLVALVTRIVSVTARSVASDLPLRVSLEPAIVVAGIAVYLMLTVVLVGRATRRAFGSPRGPRQVSS